MSIYNKYLKYKKKYLDLYALKTQMKGGADVDDLEPGLLQPTELLQEPTQPTEPLQELIRLTQALPHEMKLELISKMSDAQKINLVYSSDKFDLGTQYLYGQITFEQAFRVRVRNWRIIDKFRLTNILVKNLDELNAFSAHRNHIYIKYLKFGDYFNQSLGTSLNKLKNLQVLKFGAWFDKPLEKSLDELKNLKELQFGYKFNQDLGNSLDELKNLQVLIFDADFDKPLGKSLDNLENLKELKLGSKYNQDLGNSLNELKNLEILDLGNMFGHKIQENILKLPHLKKIIFQNKIIYPIP
jgi:hypothetical protein